MANLAPGSHMLGHARPVAGAMDAKQLNAQRTWYFLMGLWQ
jgi:hypothetical protein